MLIADHTDQYELIACGDGYRLERWRDIYLRRPDPQAIWPMPGNAREYAVHAQYIRSSNGGGQWEHYQELPERWELRCGGLDFHVRPTGFKHTGLFPEQSVNWAYLAQCIAGAQKDVRVLNLFGYTGGATVACAKAGASIVHVDAAKGMVQWAKENMALNGLSGAPVRYMVDDCMKFVQRELRRGNTYHIILMDPPSYGRGPGGEVWHIEDKLYALVQDCARLLSPDARLLLINSYTTGMPPGVLRAILTQSVQAVRGGSVDAQEIGLPATLNQIILPCGACARWTN